MGSLATSSNGLRNIQCIEMDKKNGTNMTESATWLFDSDVPRWCCNVGVTIQGTVQDDMRICEIKSSCWVGSLKNPFQSNNNTRLWNQMKSEQHPGISDITWYHSKKNSLTWLYNLFKFSGKNLQPVGGFTTANSFLPPNCSTPWTKHWGLVDQVILIFQTIVSLYPLVGYTHTQWHTFIFSQFPKEPISI